MSAATVTRHYGVIDGQEVPLTECDWIQYAPCGCPCAISVAQLEHSDHVVASQEAAEIGFTGTETKTEAERDRKAGFVTRLIRHVDFRAIESFGKCPHTPKWGIEPDPTPPGFAWAIDGSRGQKYRHLVAAERVTDTSYDAQAKARRGWARSTEGPTLCGLGKWGAWHDDGHIKGDTMACSKCIAKAKAMQLPAPVGAP